jgi:hypothetical protein
MTLYIMILSMKISSPEKKGKGKTIYISALAKEKYYLAIDGIWEVFWIRQDLMKERIGLLP